VSVEARLVCIDMQNVFGDPASPWAAPAFPDALAGVLRLRPAFGAHVVDTRYVAPAEPTGAWIPYFRDWPFALVPDTDPIYDTVPALADDGHPVVTETTFGKWGPRLAAALGGSTEMVLAGVSTDCCVLSTALAAADAGVHVRVVSDACAGLSPADHRRALEAMALYAPLIEVTTVDAVLASLPPTPA
jgi:nicotinamidase-related amidase